MPTIKELKCYSIDHCPFKSFQNWFEEALTKEENPSAFSLATATSQGVPSVRFLLFKGLENGKFAFFTNRKSSKSKCLSENPFAAMAFYWHKSGKQVRISGKVEEMNRELVKDYCSKRPRLSQAATYVSRQGQKLESRDELIKSFEQCLQNFEGKSIPVPNHWTGYSVIPHEIEFFIYGEHRLNDRFLFEKKGTESWEVSRLAP
tara:strand:+ start:2476 stop:3087 length:612 start_codon:yes stop_codon:yes gene_type:complete